MVSIRGNVQAVYIYIVVPKTDGLLCQVLILWDRYDRASISLLTRCIYIRRSSDFWVLTFIYILQRVLCVSYQSCDIAQSRTPCSNNKLAIASMCWQNVHTHEVRSMRVMCTYSKLKKYMSSHVLIWFVVGVTHCFCVCLTNEQRQYISMHVRSHVCVWIVEVWCHRWMYFTYDYKYYINSTTN